MSDVDWIRSVVERHERELVAYTERLLRDRERARDCVQEAFLRLCRRADSDARERPGIWLLTVCRRLAIDVLRKEKRMVRTTVEPEVVAHDGAPGPEAVAERKDESSRVLELLESLSDDQQEVLRLKFRHGLTYSQIAEVTNLGLGNVGYLISTGLKDLRARLRVAGGSGVEA